MRKLFLYLLPVTWPGLLCLMAHFLRFAPKTSDATRAFVREQLTKTGLDVYEDDHDRDVLIVQATFELLTIEVEELKVKRPLASCEEMVLGHKVPLMAQFKASELRKFEGADNPDTFFSPADQARFTWSILTRKIPSVSQKLQILGHKVSNPEDPFIVACEHSEPPVLSKGCLPLHKSKEFREDIMRSVVMKSFVASKEAVTKIRDYFGEEVALYFVWMDFFGKMLIFPAILGIVNYTLMPRDVPVEEDPFMPIFSAFMALWSIVYLVVS